MSTLLAKPHTFSVSELATAIKQLSREQLDVLEMELNRKFTDEVLARGESAWAEYERGETLPLDQMKKALSLV